MASSPSQSARNLSLRDPAGELHLFDGRLVRLVRDEGVSNLDIFLDSDALGPFREDGELIGGRRIDPSTVSALCGGERPAAAVEHDLIPFVSYPYEWPAEMLLAAAKLTLNLAKAGIDEGIGLKDAKPDNVMFRGPGPVFIDALSFENRTPGDPIWRAEGQFIRTFLLPLLAHREAGLSINELLLNRSDGLEPEEVYRLLGPIRRLAPGNLGLVTLPAKLSRFADDSGIYRQRVLPSDEKARYILGGTLARLNRNLRRVAPKAGRSSGWSDYMATTSYSEADFAQKETFVAAALNEVKPQTALDVGCNTGHFSRLLAKGGASVVAVDLDPVVVGEAWRQARFESLDILTLVQDLSQPSPGTGWRNQERASFLSRAQNRFDAVVMLAIAHHMMVSDGIPLSEILALAAEMTKDAVIIEFVAREDTQFQRIVRGRDDLYRDYDRDAFETACRERFEIQRRKSPDGATRALYLLRLKGG
ncbi:MAG: methyltransferase domain-containing protein [Proteobacteria bacterium]|nr:methyltransferase domain-containing protein [Pseudomonadota bacterium]